MPRNSATSRRGFLRGAGVTATGGVGFWVGSGARCCGVWIGFLAGFSSGGGGGVVAVVEGNLVSITLGPLPHNV